ncbi:MAG: Crp/Fnr family transcriptional regulator [Kiritimatiellia bacterium]
MLLNGLSREDCEKLFADIGVIARRYEKGENIITPGDELNRFWLMVDGEAHAYVWHSDGKRHVASIALPGDTFGLLFAYSGLKEHPTQMVAAKDSVVLEFPVLDLPKKREIVSRDIEKRFVTNMLAVMSSAAFRARLRAVVVSHKSIESRISSFLSMKANIEKSKSFDLHLDRQELADFLDVDRSALSSTLSRMQKRGMIRFHKNHFEIIGKLKCSER